ncbi:MAG: hypothetical protein H7A23_04210 [Leptospiraceae bacterium]|nr:hypothetical protein [Leptospiraceae bacterium]MCP5493736.1 hypothetical protein [Leptospiraceae bacterium]
MKLKLYLLLISLLLNFCFVPKPVEPIKNERCELRFKQYTLGIHENSSYVAEESVHAAFDCDKPECVLVVLSIVPVSSFVVSGSIVIVGNTIHWLEKQGMCEDSFVQSKIKEFKSRDGD